jgi:excisionase family DNA binding protein
VRSRLTYTVQEAAELLGISRSAAYECVHRGEIPALTLGRRLLVTRTTLESMLGVLPETEPADGTNVF